MVTWVTASFPAYRMHVRRSTGRTLLGLEEGRNMDTKGQTELKVRDFASWYW